MHKVLSEDAIKALLFYSRRCAQLNSEKAIIHSLAICLAWTIAAAAQTITGAGMALQSSGTASSTNWTLGSDGYVGTYIQLSQPAPVSFTVDASGQSSGGLSPDMTLAIADDTQSFNVSSASLSNYTYTTPTLPAGTYFVRLQLDNQTATQTPDLTIGNLQVSGSGVSVSNTNTSANAMTAAQDYVNNFRQGQMNVSLNGQNGVPLPSGTSVQVKLVQNGFSLGSAVYDSFESNSFYSTYPWMTATSSSTGNGALAYDYQQFLLKNFATIEPENAGKWSSDEPTQGSVNMSTVDQISNFAEAHNLNVRMHNLAAESQQPNFVNTLFTNNNVSGINSAVTSRIGYYVSGNNTQTGPADGSPRTLAYSQMDVLNEGLHASGTQPNYIKTLGYSGVANIFSQVAKAVSAAGGNTHLYTNEYNVLQNSANPATNASDPYANWYLNEVQSINNAGYGKVVSGIGSEFYVTTQVANPTNMQEAMQNLAVTGLPLTLTEFGIATGTTAANAATDLQDAFTMVYGNPMATTFDFWDFWLKLEQNDSFLDGYEAGALMDASGNPTSLYTNTLLPMLEADGYVIPGDVTPMDLTVGANGQISFNGTYGTYEIIVDGQTYYFTSSPTSNSLSLFTDVTVPEPASAALLVVGGVGLLARRRRQTVI
jgi:GH35 family endo-1,4-beta-xylanase